MKAWMKTAAVLCLAVLTGWPMAAPAQNIHTLPLVRPAGFAGQESLVRIINRSATSGTVRITAIDDNGRRFGPVTLTLGARRAVNITSGALERGSAGIGLPVGVGDGEGSWRLELATALTIEPLAYIRTPDKFLTSMHDEAPVSEGGDHWVPFFNPGSNTSKISHLRIINPGATAAAVTITGRDDAGEASGTVRLTLPAGAARTLSAQDLEGLAVVAHNLGALLDGSLGDGAGKWRLNVRSTADIRVMSLLSTETGHLANLSTALSNASGGSPPEPPPPPPPEPPSGDDHGNDQATATIIRAPSTTAGRLEVAGDVDVFRFDLPRAGRLQVETTGNTDTIGAMTRIGSSGSVLWDDDSGTGANFRITQEAAQAGTWSVAVAGFGGTATGAYTLQVSFGTSPPPPEPTVRYGAIYSRFTNPGSSCAWRSAITRNQPTRQAAEALAREGCGSGCTLRAWFTQCGALAFGERRQGQSGNCRLQGGIGGTSTAAEQDALNRCRLGGYTCRIAVSRNGIRFSLCNTGYAAKKQYLLGSSPGVATGSGAGHVVTMQELLGETGEVYPGIESTTRDPQ